MLKFKFLGYFLVFLLVFNLNAQKDSIMQVARVSGIVLDGRVDEPVWDAISPLPLIQYEPNAGAAPTEHTEIRLAYDDTYFYVSMRAYDKDPDGIRATSLYRDRIAGSDHLEIMIDSYNDNQSGFIFTTTPAGIRNDLTVYNDATGGTISSSDWANRNFNTFWDAETTVTEKGWFGEMRIPFSSLRFEEKDGAVIMGVSLQRKVARKRERLVFPAIGPVSNYAFLRPSMAQKIILYGIKPSRKIYVSPYVRLGEQRNQMLNSNGTAYLPVDATNNAVGADAKVSLSNNLTADFTYNTDFAQAEADDQMVNLSRFSLFFPEKRQFFLERASLFDFRTGGQSRLFFSRRIGLNNSGNQVPILGGIRLVGRMKTWDIGLLDMQTKGDGDLTSENFGALRFRKRIFNRNSYIGGLFTSRINGMGQNNFAYGIDGVIQITGDDYMTMQWAQTFDQNSSTLDKAKGFDSGRLALELNKRRRQGFGYTVGTILSGPNYNPGVGFVDRQDFKFGSAAFSNTWVRPSGPFIWHKGEIIGNAYWDNGDGNILSSEVSSGWSFSGRGLDSGGLLLTHSYERLKDDFGLADGAMIPAGEYDFLRLKGSYIMALDKKIRAGITGESGTFYDGYLHTLTFTPSWYISRYIQLDLEYAYNMGRFEDRNSDLNFHLGRLRLGTAINRKISTNALLQYNGAEDLFAMNIRFRWNFKEGQDFWVVYNSGINTKRYLSVPTLPALNARALLVKYTHTFIF